MNSGWMYCVCQNQAIAAYLSLYFSLEFPLKTNCRIFLRNLRPRKLKIGTHVDKRWMYFVYQNQAAAAYFSLIFLYFLFQLSNFKIFRHTFLMTYEVYKVETMLCEQWVDVSCTLESDCCCLFVPLFLHFSFSNLQLQICLSAEIAL